MEIAETYAEPSAPHSVEAIARFIENVVTYHPDGGRWAHLPALIRSHRDRSFYVPPSTTILDLAGSIATGHV